MDLLRPKWTKMDHFGPFWSRECQNPVRNKVILTKMVVWTILESSTLSDSTAATPYQGIIFHNNFVSEGKRCMSVSMSIWCHLGSFGRLWLREVWMPLGQPDSRVERAGEARRASVDTIAALNRQSVYSHYLGRQNCHGHFDPVPSPVVYNMSKPMGGGFHTPLALRQKALQ